MGRADRLGRCKYRVVTEGRGGRSSDEPAAGTTCLTLRDPDGWRRSLTDSSSIVRTRKGAGCKMYRVRPQRRTCWGRTSRLQAWQPSGCHGRSDPNPVTGDAAGDVREDETVIEWRDRRNRKRSRWTVVRFRRSGDVIDIWNGITG